MPPTVLDVDFALLILLWHVPCRKKGQALLRGALHWKSSVSSCSMRWQLSGRSWENLTT